MKNYVLTTLTLLTFIPSFAQIIIHPGDNIQDLVDANPSTSTFILKSGIHRLQSVSTKSGNTFIGEDGAVMNGARLLENWYSSNGHWVHDGQDQNGQQHGECATGNNTCRYAEDLFLDNELLEQVDNMNSVTSGKWYFDYDSDKVYMADSPSGHTVEISTSRKAFGNTNASNVTIDNIIIEKYAIPAQMGAIGDQYPGSDWIIENCESRFNHGVGIKVADASIVRNCHIHHNGQMGIGASGTGGLIENNEINDNLTVGYNWGWEGGASKFQGTDGLIVRGNYVHHNNGPGLWTDINNIHTTYEENLVEYNLSMGIFHEISYDAVIRCNTVRYNSESSNQWLYGSQILISTSENAEVYNNNVTVSASGGNGITALNQDRGSKWYCQNNYIHNNDITYLGDEGVSGVATDYDHDNFWNNSNNRFDSNRYHLSNTSINRWRWQSGNYSWTSFNNQGQGINSTIDSDLSLEFTTACAGDNASPILSFQTPFDGAIFKEGSSMGVIIDATDIDGSIVKVELLFKNVSIREEQNPPYEWGSASINDEQLQNLTVGTHTLTAIATDNLGKTGSTSITIIVNESSGIDCFGEQGGNATIDNCGQCVGGSTEQTSCTEDCFGEWGGLAITDDCEICSGGNTGIEINSDCIIGINESTTNSSLILYPNPVHNSIYLQEDVPWTIYNHLGLIIRSGHSEVILVEELPHGNYFLKVGSARSQFVKM